MRCNLKRKSNFKLKGLTLVELIVVVAIVAIILGAIYSFFIQNFKVAQENINIARIEGEAKRLNDQVKQWLSMSDQSTINYMVVGTTKQVIMDVYQNDLPALTARPDFRIKLIYDSSSKSISIEKDFLTSSSGSSVPSPAVFIFLNGLVERFDCVYVSDLKIVIEYEVVVNKRGANRITRVYKVEHVFRNF
ncbi:prepilin-type N-terminal cleavage/methylation domain-containing protein [Caldicellulosiruptor naganoensis]|uniref:Prepilin-type N-terminal cleavage/methylation domain-containing protein n=1 Tax=Caldicellulosiruptor naganoensis TaxID=29324 RepID=A0ABY7BI80_9FIRM|nr:prepilin-type N-terminal cleavage/methylation domain-containing protein [Caldicellulosiruptor naganoensis]WAM32309.1 prepilin-type N-terminal cleavage/methylation domain-containing protein [Caldicellulosiruptor naganoensis]